MTARDVLNLVRKYSEDEARDFHGRWTNGGAGAGVDAETGKITSAGIDRMLAFNPPKPNEPSFEYQARLVAKLDPDTKSEVLFRIRERYPIVGYIAEGAARWRDMHGLPQPKDAIIDQRCSLDKADEVARYFETATDQSNDPKVTAAFADFKVQNEAQWDFATKPVSEGGLGITVDFVHTPNGNPYETAEEQSEDLRSNHHINIESGLGGQHQATMTVNEYDRFRAVHDIFGHAGVGGGFDRHGEYEAWLMHMSMYTGLGREAMSSEYHGVNSALWSGDPKDPGGTGKSILLPEKLIRDPWDENGHLVRKSKRAAPDAIDRLIRVTGLDSTFANAYERGHWHGPVTPVTKAYNEDEPRDEHGRWTAGGGGAAGQQSFPGMHASKPKGDASKPKVVVPIMQGLKLDRGNAPARSFQPFSDTIATLANEFPGVVKSGALTLIRGATIGDDTGVLAETAGPDYDADTDFNLMFNGDGGYVPIAGSITMNTTPWLDAAQEAEDFANGKQSEFMSHSDSVSPETYTATHEFGHTLFNALGPDAQQRVWNAAMALAKPDQVPDWSPSGVAPIDTDKIAENLSFYATTSQNEFVAEAFSEARLDPYPRSWAADISALLITEYHAAYDEHGDKK